MAIVSKTRILYKVQGHSEVLELDLVHVQYMTVPKEGGGDARCDIMVMFSPGSPISLDPKEERKEGSPISLDPIEERKGRNPY